MITSCGRKQQQTRKLGVRADNAVLVSVAGRSSTRSEEEAAAGWRVVKQEVGAS